MRRRKELKKDPSKENLGVFKENFLGFKGDEPLTPKQPKMVPEQPQTEALEGGRGWRGNFGGFKGRGVNPQPQNALGVSPKQLQEDKRMDGRRKMGLKMRFLGQGGAPGVWGGSPQSPSPNWEELGGSRGGFWVWG